STLNKIIDNYKSKNHKIGDISVKCHSITLIDKFEKILPEYPVPLGIRDEVRNHLNELIKSGIISETQPKYISPAFVIKKKNGKIRLVVDYQYLNSITKKAHQFIPNITEILSCLKDINFFSQIDLNQGYYQIHMSKDDIEKTGIKIRTRHLYLIKCPSDYQMLHQHSKSL
ncbi:Retrovirus-related Pol polyprotein from transposon opus, partial [Dictyocoela muelleri]